MDPLVSHGPRHSTAALPDEEALAEDVAPERRRTRGAFFTPGWLVDRVFDDLAPFVPARGPLAVVDPSCGAGAFLVRAAGRFPRARLLGLELDPSSAARCRARVPKARVRQGDGLRPGALEALLADVPRGAFLAWVGNPPYNGRSPLLDDKDAWNAVRALLPPRFELPPGTSLRDDYAFFLLRAATRLAGRPGALAFVTSASLLDAFLYAPLRRALLDWLELRVVRELPPGTFRGTQVRTCVTVWTSPRRQQRRVHFRGDSPDEAGFTPAAPAFALRPASDEAARLDARWRAVGEPLTRLVPVSFTGLKTRFDELLVDEDPQALLARIDAFLRTPPSRLERFARAHGLPERTWGKLRALRAAAPEALRASTDRVRPFHRYAGDAPLGSPSFCYLERALIPRGDHRLQGAYDPHACDQRLVFNTRELPLHALALDAPGCVTAYRHARFAPLWVPKAALRGRPREGGPASELNLSPRGRAWAAALGDPFAVYRAIAAFVRSDAVQRVWAPAFGAHADLPVPVDLLAQT